jgi:hypothetical protein
MSNRLFGKPLRDSYSRILKFITKSLRNVDGPLTINGPLKSTGAFVREGSGDFRVDSSDQTHALFVDASENEIQINSRTANATGGGFDGAAGVTQYISKVNGEIITTILVDIEDLAVGAGLRDIIGEEGVAAAYITQITTIVNGIIYKAEMSCIEAPAGTNTTADIDLAGNSNSLAEDANVAGSGTRTVMITAGAAWTAGMSRTSTLGTDFTNLVDDYLYIVSGDNAQTGGTYTAGKFVIKLYGASF